MTPDERIKYSPIAGRAPRGWLGPGLTETWNTPDILAEQGYDYVSDWVLDDQPLWHIRRQQDVLFWTGEQILNWFTEAK